MPFLYKHSEIIREDSLPMKTLNMHSRANTGALKFSEVDFFKGSHTSHRGNSRHQTCPDCLALTYVHHLVRVCYGLGKGQGAGLDTDGPTGHTHLHVFL